ncbi:MAG TPA: hypothetical protein VEH07_09285 [Alphaproteobacteria bacterium]|nr:hypothetical protein [Alphaproteobacteria bacterium]
MAAAQARDGADAAIEVRDLVYEHPNVRALNGISLGCSPWSENHQPVESFAP